MGYSVIALDYFLLKVILYNSILWRQYIWDRVPPSFFCYRDILLWHPSVTIILPLHPSLSSNHCRQLSITSFFIILSLQTFSRFILHVASFLISGSWHIKLPKFLIFRKKKTLFFTAAAFNTFS